MHTKKVIQDLKQKWLDKCLEYNYKNDELMKLSDQKQGVVDDELSKAEQERKELDKRVKESLAAYHKACYENLVETLRNMTDNLHKELISNSFSERTKIANDWDQVMDDLNLW